MSAHREASSLNTTHGSPLTGPDTEEDLELYLGASENFGSSYTALNDADLDSSPIDSALTASLGTFEAHNRLSFSHPATANPSSPAQNFQRPQPPRSIRNAPKSRHGSSAPTTDPWTPIILSDEPLKGQSHSTGSMQRRDNRLPTDSGYASSLKSANPTITLTTFDQESVQYLVRNESSDRRQQHYLPDQQTASVANPKSIRSRTTSFADQTEDRQDDEDVIPGCEICSTQFNTNSEYTKHMARHKKDFKCLYPKCKKTDGFATQNDLDRHVKSVHNLVDVEDNVWRCFYEGCKSASKTWPRQDNFRAHVERMHKEADIDEYVKKSDDWLENIEKPRRRREQKRQELLLQQQQLNQNMDLSLAQSDSFFQHPVGVQFRYPGSDSQEPLSAQFSGMPYAQSMTGDLPGSQDFAMSNMTFTSGQQVYPHSPSLCQNNHTNNHLSAQASNHMARSYSSRVQSTLPNVDGPDTHNPIYSWRGNDSTHLLDIGVSDSPNTPIVPMDRRTMPDMHGPYSVYGPDFGTSHVEYGSSTVDSSQVFSGGIDPNALSFMGPDPTQMDDTQYINGSAMAVEEFAELELPTNNPPGACSQSQPAQQIKYDDCDDIDELELDGKLKEALKDHSFRRKLQELIKEHNFEATSSVLLKQPGSGNMRSATQSLARGDVRELHSCPRCPKKFTKKNVRNKHVKRHLQQFFCTVDGCYKRFGTKQDMQRHESKCNKQPLGWRCWSVPKSRANHKGCHEFFQNPTAFQAHHKEHWTARRQIDEFKVERDFHGSFWCGFCNAVIQNPASVGCDGTPRLKFRYDHIEKHVVTGKDIDEWYELKGDGKTKGQIKKEQDDAKKISSCSPNDDDDSDDDGDTEDSPQSSIDSTRSIRRPRSYTLPDVHQRLVLPSTMSSGPSRGVKRAHDDEHDVGVDLRRGKAPHLVHTLPATGPNPPTRHSISNGRPGAIQQTPPTSKPSQIRCCRCEMIRSSNGTLTCPKCFQPACRACKFFTSDGQHMTLPRKPPTQETK